MRRDLAHRVPVVIEKLMESSLAGDVAAAKLLLERVFPVLRPGEMYIKLPLKQGPKDLSAAAQSLLNELAEGNLTPHNAMTIAGVMATLTRIQESLDLTQRIERLEAQAGDLPALTSTQRTPPRWGEAALPSKHDEEEPE